MATSAFPSVIAAVVTVAQRALPGVQVVRGNDNSNEPGDLVLVGAQNVDDPEYSSAGSFQQTRQTFGGAREEVGTVNCAVLAWNGDADQAAACATAFDYIAAIEAAVRADPTLGLTGFDYMLAEFQAGDVAESQDTTGAVTVVSFVISYQARI